MYIHIHVHMHMNLYIYDTSNQSIAHALKLGTQALFFMLQHQAIFSKHSYWREIETFEIIFRKMQTHEEKWGRRVKLNWWNWDCKLSSFKIVDFPTPKFPSKEMLMGPSPRFRKQGQHWTFTSWREGTLSCCASIGRPICVSEDVSLRELFYFIFHNMHRKEDASGECNHCTSSWKIKSEWLSEWECSL